MGAELTAGSNDPAETVDALVIGAGFGGLGAALHLAESGKDVLLCEALNYPGGCASTFERGGASYESGATLFAGFGKGQLFERWIRRYALDVPLETHDPIVTLRTASATLEVGESREEFVARIVEASDADEGKIRAFFRYQQRIAETLWGLFDNPDRLPPFDLAMLLKHAQNLTAYIPLLSLVGRTVRTVLKRFGLAEDPVVCDFLNAVCQITVQAGIDEAEAPFALAAMDYYFRGCRHVSGGIGVLAREMARAVELAGGRVTFTERVRRIERCDEGYRVTTRRGSYIARTVFANVLPEALQALCDPSVALRPALDRLGAQVASGWGATMLYLLVERDAPLHDFAHHLELVDDRTLPFIEGNHIFVSVSGKNEQERAPDGLRTVTISTHIDARTLSSLQGDALAEHVQAVQERMRQTLARRAPEVAEGIRREMTASPRTWERFTRRSAGLVGGIPRRVGLHNYRQLGAFRAADGLYLIGDTVFPGQSTLATALGGRIAAETALRRELRKRRLPEPTAPSGALTST